MATQTPRAIAVLDVGATNTKLMLFDERLNPVASEKVASAKRGAPPYASIDPAPILALAEEALPAFDVRMPVDVVVPCTHGSALALLGTDGHLALPIMDYNAEPPSEIVAAYDRIAPPFSEVKASTSPGGQTLARQLFWQEHTLAERFQTVQAITPLPQALAHWLGGRLVAERTVLGAQSHLWDMGADKPSTIARERGWARLFPPLARAWERVGTLAPRFCGAGLRGRGQIVAGIHDSSANYLRYLGVETGRFALLSTGTWIIGFDSGADPHALAPGYDTACGLTVYGTEVPVFRFKGGTEFSMVANGAVPDAAQLGALVARGVMALPNFTDSGGPAPEMGTPGSIEGNVAPHERGTLAAVYCALMSVLALSRMSGAPPPRVTVDGPFSTNAVYLGALAALLPGSTVLASALQEGTAAGAALLALADAQGQIPQRSLELHPTLPAKVPGLAAYARRWRERIDASARSRPH